jgi:hypothetical protein
MAVGLNRRLDRLEERTALKGRTVFIWNDYEPGCVEREKARLMAAGSLTEQDQVVIIGWIPPAE